MTADYYAKSSNLRIYGKKIVTIATLLNSQADITFSFYQVEIVSFDVKRSDPHSAGVARRF